MQIIFSDIDGTLLNQDHQVTPATARAIKSCVDNGLYFVPVSARMPEAIRPIIDGIGIPSPIIAYNGALIQAQDGAVVDSKTIAMPEVLSVCRTVENLGQDLAWNIYSYSDWYSSHQGHDLVHNEEVVVALESQVADLDQLDSLKEAHKVLVMCPPSRTDQVLQALKQGYSDLSIAKSAAHLIEVMAAGIDKGQAVKTLADYYSVPINETLAFGDNYNDLEMLETVGHGILMGNAPKALQDRIGQVTLDHNHDGIAKVLQEEIL